MFGGFFAFLVFVKVSYYATCLEPTLVSDTLVQSVAAGLRGMDGVEDNREKLPEYVSCNLNDQIFGIKLSMHNEANMASSEFQQ